MKINPDKCVACGNCTYVCQVGAISVDPVINRATVNRDECVECYACYYGLSTERLNPVLVRTIRKLFQIARLPDEAFQGLFKAFFTFAIPMLLVSNVPVRVLVDKFSAGSLLLLLVMSALCFLVSECGWKASLRHYTSASS